VDAPDHRQRAAVSGVVVVAALGLLVWAVGSDRGRGRSRSAVRDRLADVLPASPGPPDPPSGDESTVVARIVARAGQTTPRQRVLVAAVVAGSVVVGPVPGVLGLGGWVVHRRLQRSRSAAQQAVALLDELPDVIDLLRLGVGAGLTVHLAVAAVARHGDGALAAGFARALVQADGGARLADALEPMRHLGPPAVPLIDALLAADRYGTPLAPALVRLGDDARQLRRRRVEEEARKVPVRLLFPLVACVLPSVGLLTVVPVAVAALRGLSW